jgi:hypothetical protein
MAHTQRVGGWAMLAHAAFAVFVTVVIGISIASLGFEDGDNPAVGLQFFRDHGDVYVLAGIGVVLMATALAVASLSLDEVLTDRANRLARRLVTASGLFATAFLLAAGIFQISAPGPVLRIAEFGEADGRSAYLVVQTAGTQVAFTGGLLLVSVWAVGLCLLGGRQRLLPVPLAWLGVIPALRVLVGLFGPLLDDASSALWALSVLVMVGMNGWFIAVGAWLVVRARTVRTALPAA